jgi:hypothetical protein
LTQQQSFAVESEKLGEAIKKFGLRKPGINNTQTSSIKEVRGCFNHDTEYGA